MWNKRHFGGSSTLVLNSLAFFIYRGTLQQPKTSSYDVIVVSHHRNNAYVKILLQFRKTKILGEPLNEFQRNFQNLVVRKFKGTKYIGKISLNASVVRYAGCIIKKCPLTDIPQAGELKLKKKIWEKSDKKVDCAVIEGLLRERLVTFLDCRISGSSEEVYEKRAEKSEYNCLREEVLATSHLFCTLHFDPKKTNCEQILED